MEVYVVLISVFNSDNGRKMAERIENTKFKKSEMTKPYSRSIADDLQETWGVGYDVLSVYPITDFMDNFNDEEVIGTDTWFSYVYLVD
jgi:hypothetical protein